MKARFVCGAVAVLFALGAHAAQLQVTGGAIRGTYAAPPVGALRWMPPQRVVPWRGVRATIAPPAPCAQLSPRTARNLRQRVCPLMTAGYRNLTRNRESTPQPPLASQPDVCDVSSNPLDVLLCKSAAAANRSSAQLEAP